MRVRQCDFQAKNAPEVFVQSLKETGFGVLQNHDVDIGLLNDVYRQWNKFFAQSLEQKSMFKNTDNGQTGYFPPLSENAKDAAQKDLKEFFQYFKGYDLPNGVEKQTEELFKQLEYIAKTLLDWVEAHTPDEVKNHFSQPLSQMIENSPNTMLRILNYPPLTGEEEKGAIRAAAHGDINFLTILPAATESGLQVKDVKGNWHDVETNSGNLVVNIGDMLEKATGGYYPSTIHRVVNPTEPSAMKKNRMSMPLFLHARSEVKIDDDLTAGQFLEQRLKEIGLK